MNTDAPWPDAKTAWVRVLKIQTKLHQWATDDRCRRFNDLWNLVYDPAVLVEAWHRVRSNRGARTAGVDGETAYYVTTVRGEQAFLSELRDQLKTRKFQPLPVRQVTIPKLLRSAGYQTAIVGKWHLVSDPTGFDYWEILPGQGQYYNPPMFRNGQRVKKAGYVTDVITDDALDWLKSQRDPNKPFLLMCQHKAPHREWEPALKHLADYDGVKFPEPPTLLDHYEGRSKAVDTSRCAR